MSNTAVPFPLIELFVTALSLSPKTSSSEEELFIETSSADSADVLSSRDPSITNLILEFGPTDIGGIDEPCAESVEFFMYTSSHGVTYETESFSMS